MDMVVARDDCLVETRCPRRRTITVAASRLRHQKSLVEEFQTTMPDRITGIVHATTVATNAILEGATRAPAPACRTTEGFRDVLEMRRLRIPVLYDSGNTTSRSRLAARLSAAGGARRLDADGLGPRPGFREADVR